MPMNREQREHVFNEKLAEEVAQNKDTIDAILHES